MAGKADATRIRLVIEGRVQGVGYRYFVRERARTLGVAGWVRNLADGRVELEASGSPESIAQLRTALQAGPPGAMVTRMEETTPGTERLANPFAIVR